MVSFHFATLLLLAGVAASEHVTPIAKVITLLDDLKAEVVGDGEAEAKTYDEFACFCRDTTEKKAGAITQGQDDIDQLAAEIQAKTAEKAAKLTEVEERQKKQEELAKELEDTNARCLKEKMEYEATSADLSKAISSLDGAIKVLEASKPTAAALISIRESVSQSLALADALNLVESKRQEAVSAFLQVDPNDPEYKYHSQGIIEVLEKLLKDFRAQKADVDAEFEKAKKACDDLKASLAKEIDENKKAIIGLNESIENLKIEIAQAREDLVNAEGALKDDQMYLKDLTERCEARAKDWDQRSAMRADELSALTEALTILKGQVQGADESVNKRALLFERARHVLPVSHSQTQEAALSFLQGASSRALALNLLEKASGGLSTQTQKDQVLALLSSEGRRLGSAVLSSLAMQVAADPFVKVKELIQKLIERLLRESTAEATKKGFCDTELGKSRQDRDFRFADVKKLNAELAGLEAKKDELEEELESLASSLKELNEQLVEATKLRADEKEENIATLKEAKEGLAALKEAITILKVFYKQSGKAKVFLQASPVDEDTSGPGFDGAYKGKQAASKGIIGLLEVIKSDFERTLKTTAGAEKKAAADFVEFDRTSKADIGGKETKTTLDEQDLETTKTTIEKKMKDLTTNMDLLDDALKVIEELKPACIDTGMSYTERVAKREEEIAALKKALCMLDADKVEPECQ